MKAGSDKTIDLIDLKRQQERLRSRIDAAMARVLEHGAYILGPEVAQFETQLAKFCGARHAVSCANGTDALVLALMALQIGTGDAVLVPSFTFCATAEAVVLRGATPIFVDTFADTFNMDPASLEAGVLTATRAGLRARAVIAVDLFGLPADYDRLQAVADAHGLTVICDAAQGFGGIYGDRRVGTLGTITTTSFFPAKPLGCYGDGGALFTDDPMIAAALESLRVHGKGTHKYDNVRIGTNSRLDTLQAAILLEKLAVFADELAARDAVAERYDTGLSDVVATPVVPAGLRSAWAQYTLRVPAHRRDAIAAELKRSGIATAVYYPLPLHLQTAYRSYPRVDDLSRSEAAAHQVLSLPMHPYLSTDEQEFVIGRVRSILRDPTD